MTADKKKIIIIMVSSIVLAAGIYLLWPRKAVPPKIKTDPVKSLSLNLEMFAKADELDITNFRGNFVLKKSGDNWNLISPVKFRANSSMIEKILTRVAGMGNGVIISKDPKNFKEYKLLPPKAVTVVIKRNGKIVKTLYFGKSRKFTLIREKGKNEVWRVKGALRQLFVKSLRDWVNPKIIPYETKDIKGISYLNTEGKVIFAFSRAANGEITQIKGEKPEKFEAGNVTYSLIKFLKIRPSNIITDKKKINEIKKKIYGYIELTIKDGTKEKYALSHAGTNDVAVFKSENTTWIPLIKKHFLTHVYLTKTEDLISKLIFAIKKENLAGFISHCGGLEFEAKLTDNGNFRIVKKNKDFIIAKSRLKVFLHFLERGKIKFRHMKRKDEIKDSGISDKSDFITFIDKQGKKTTITFGKQTLSDVKIKEWRYAAVSTEPDHILLMDEYIVKKICRDKVAWQLKNDDMENIPTKKLFEQ